MSERAKESALEKLNKTFYKSKIRSNSQFSTKYNN